MKAENGPRVPTTEKFMSRLENRIALVTGAAMGIGFGIAKRFIAEGATVICADIHASVDELPGTLGELAIPMFLDVTQEFGIVSVMNSIRDRWGKLDVLCNNVGVSGRKGRLAELEAADFDQVITTDLKSVFLMIKYAIPLMQAAGGGSIINIASTAGLGAVPGRSIYSSAKAGVMGLTRTVGFEYGVDRIRANSICPTGIDTPQFRSVNTPETAAAFIDRHAIKRLGMASDIASAAAFLASDDANFVTGVAIPVDGGLTAA